MNKLIPIVAAVFLAGLPLNGAISSPPVESPQPSPGIVQMHHEMIYPAVQVQARKGKGSGTVIYSKKTNGHYETFVLTNFHVISGAIEEVEEYDYEKREEVKRIRLEPVQILFPLYNDLSKYVGTQGRIADIVAYDARSDLALVLLRDEESRADHVATLMPEDSRLDMGETVWAVGGGLGKPPFISTGILGYMHERIDGYEYHLSTAPIIFGNSGGALYRKSDEGYELIGVPSRVSAVGFGNAVTHMAWSIKIETIREFLRRKDYGYILGDERTEEDTTSE